MGLFPATAFDPYVHIYVMQSVTKDKLDLLLADLRRPATFEFEPLRASEEAPRKHAQVERLVHVPHHGRGFR